MHVSTAELRDFLIDPKRLALISCLTIVVGLGGALLAKILPTSGHGEARLFRQIRGIGARYRSPFRLPAV